MGPRCHRTTSPSRMMSCGPRLLRGLAWWSPTSDRRRTCGLGGGALVSAAPPVRSCPLTRLVLPSTPHTQPLREGPKALAVYLLARQSLHQAASKTRGESLKPQRFQNVPFSFSQDLINGLCRNLSPGLSGTAGKTSACEPAGPLSFLHLTDV